MQKIIFEKIISEKDRLMSKKGQKYLYHMN